MRTSPYLLFAIIVQNALMGSKTRKSETVKVSRLGCMRKSTVETDMAGKTVEHVEVWVDEVADSKRGDGSGRISSPAEQKSE